MSEYLLIKGVKNKFKGAIGYQLHIASMLIHLLKSP